MRQDRESEEKSCGQYSDEAGEKWKSRGIIRILFYVWRESRTSELRV
jgi:hypothetical protein